MTNMGMASVRKVHPLFCWGCYKSGQKLVHNSWSTLAQQLLCKRISAVMQAHNSCCAADDTDCLNNRFYLFQQQIPSLSTTDSVSFNNRFCLFQQHDLSLSTT